jgi:Fe-S cluster assembly iron-binding protein IscA
MALDESKEDDEVFKENGLTFAINKELFELAKPITLDYIASRMGAGFKLSSSLDTGSSCGGSCSSC